VLNPKNIKKVKSLYVSELSSMRSSAKAPDDVLSPLHIASLNGSLECIKVLCEAGLSLRQSPDIVFCRRLMTRASISEFPWRMLLGLLQIGHCGATIMQF
jgi:hypothetical protein